MTARREKREQKRRITARRYALLFLIGLGGLTALIALVFDLPPAILPPVKAPLPPIVLGHYEGCLSCHQDMQGLSESHRPDAVGCASCHLGNPFSVKKDEAHAGMVLVAGNLQTARLTCGNQNCHREITERITTALMATGRGLVTVNRYVFGETLSPDGEGHLSKLAYSGADSHLRQLCALCHLSYPKLEPGPVDPQKPGGGCSACHLVYSEPAATQLQEYQSQKKVLPKIHPDLTIKITAKHCFGCHSRSSRIALSYEGWHDTMQTSESAPEILASGREIRRLDDDRLLVKMTADIHHEKGMLCVDCHGWQETMGDGTAYNHQEEQVKIACGDCHIQGEVRTKGWTELQEQDKKILKLWKRDDRALRYVTTGKEARPLLNVVLDDDSQPVLLGRQTGKKHPLKAPAAVCGTGVSGHGRLTCASCHTAWSPHCIRCHTENDPRAEGYDHLKRRWQQGAWVESIDRSPIAAGEYHADPPTLGRRGEKIDTFIPGMILTIDQDKIAGQTLFRRLYAPTASHTTARQGRSCESCHNDPLALGYGRGKLEYATGGGDGRWSFTPLYGAHPRDGLPIDAWTGFMETRTEAVSTRKNARPFDQEEQRKILLVGACLTCHKANTRDIPRLYADFTKALAGVTSRCLLPRW